MRTLIKFHEECVCNILSQITIFVLESNSQQTAGEDRVDHFENLNFTNIITPIDADKLKLALLETDYDPEQTTYLYKGFTEGFDFSYRGPVNRRNVSANIPIRIRSKVILWNKVMKEVRLGRYAGPFPDKPPFENFIQSPIGLVPKAGGQTRLIFHLSYDFRMEEDERSFNYHTPQELCSVKYNDLDHAIDNCLKLLKVCKDTGCVIFFGKTDLSSAFRQVPGKPSQFCWLCMQAQDPDTGKTFYFVDKCMPFGARINCAIFQKFSNALKHIAQMRITRKMGVKDSVTNYLDDFLFLSLLQKLCDAMIDMFINLCKEVNSPVSIEKTEKASPLMIFLGILLDGVRKLLVIPEEKRKKAIYTILTITAKKQVNC